MPVFLECQRCTACCRWPGEVRVTEAEITRIAGYLDLEEAAFIDRFTRLRQDRQGLALTDKPTGECSFLEGNDCRIQAVKPQQCRDFPNLWTRPEAREHCQAIPREVTSEEYERLMRGATGRRVGQGEGNDSATR